MRVLLVEDEEKLAKALKMGLERKGFAVDYLLDGETAQQRIEMYRNDYDLVVLDLMLPGKNGFEVCLEAREKGVTLPILVLTARDTIDDKILALDNGADDYIVKPFAFNELLARIRALLRRPKKVLPATLQIDDLVLDPSRREVYRNSARIDLTLKEFELLHCLMRQPGKVFSREDIFSNLWDFADNSLSNVIDVHIKNLRRKIDDGNSQKLLETIRGVGYRIRG
ncbi:MAG: response regulator transcription factor [Candidatus Colwellbacteria bacterium]|nr:response regulator transcription factor [Candidatus Colwellbacteria bacterium]MBI3088645.1 response regulator transcription factor [Candidatus Colwellbacteria bacterium]